MVEGWSNLGDWQHARRYSEAARALAHRLGVAAQLGPADHLLDVGVGAGAQLGVWRRDFGVTRIVAVEPDRSRARTARGAAEALGGDIAVRVGDAASLPRGSFSVILALDCAYHFDRARFFRTARQRLRPGGRLALTDIVLLRDRYRSTVSRAARACGIPRDNLVGWDGYQRALSGAGLDVQDCEDLDRDVLLGFARHGGRAPGSAARVLITRALCAIAGGRSIGYRLVTATARR